MSRLNSDEKAIKKNSDVEVVDKKTTRENENNNEKKNLHFLIPSFKRCVECKYDKSFN